MNKKQIIMVVGVAIVLLIGGGLWISHLNKKNDNGGSVTKPTSTNHTKDEVIGLLTKLDTLDRTTPLDDSFHRYLWVSNSDLSSSLNGLKQTDIDSLVYVFNQRLNNKTVNQSDINFLNSLADKIGL
jgi:hypothetical protein